MPLEPKLHILHVPRAFVDTYLNIMWTPNGGEGFISTARPLSRLKHTLTGTILRFLLDTCACKKMGTLFHWGLGSIVHDGLDCMHQTSTGFPPGITPICLAAQRGGTRLVHWPAAPKVYRLPRSLHLTGTGHATSMQASLHDNLHASTPRKTRRRISGSEKYLGTKCIIVCQ